MSVSLVGPLGMPELLILLVIIIVLFGARRIPDLARGLGEGIKNFRTAIRGDEADPKRDPGSRPPDAKP